MRGFMSDIAIPYESRRISLCTSTAINEGILFWHSLNVVYDVLYGRMIDRQSLAGYTHAAEDGQGIYL